MFEGSGIFSHKRKAMKSNVSFIPWNHCGMPLNCQVMCSVTMATKKSPSYWQCQGVSGSHPDPHWMDLPGPRSDFLRSGLLEKERPGVLAISGLHSSEASWDQIRRLVGLLPSSNHSHSLTEVSAPQSLGSGWRQTGKQATAVNERLGMGATQGTMVVWT